jgi:hypothetical protein
MDSLCGSHWTFSIQEVACSFGMPSDALSLYGECIGGYFLFECRPKRLWSSQFSYFVTSSSEMPMQYWHFSYRFRFLTTNDRNTGSSRPIKCIAHKSSRPQHYGFWHGYVLLEEGTHCIAHIALHLTHRISYILHLTSYILHLTSYILRLTSYTLHLTPYVLHLTPYTLHHIVSYSVPCDITPYVLHLTSYILHLISYRILYRVTLRLTPYILYHIISYRILYRVTCIRLVCKTYPWSMLLP